MVWYGMVWYGMVCYVMLCYVMLCYIMLCDVMTYYCVKHAAPEASELGERERERAGRRERRGEPGNMINGILNHGIV